MGAGEVAGLAFAAGVAFAGAGLDLAGFGAVVRGFAAGAFGAGVWANNREGIKARSTRIYSGYQF
jgi:hypothetical protein